jgi:hypothetical protein
MSLELASPRWTDFATAIWSAIWCKERFAARNALTRARAHTHMQKLVVAEPSTQECGGRIRTTTVRSGFEITEHVKSWSGPLASDTARRLTKDKSGMNRIARRRLARRRKYLQERKRILAERRAELIRRTYDLDGDGFLSISDFKMLLSDTLPNSTPSDEDLVLLMETCTTSSRTGQSRSARVNPSPPGILTPSEALSALSMYERALHDVATAACSVAESLSSMADLDDFEELLYIERQERELERQERDLERQERDFESQAQSSGLEHQGHNNVCAPAEMGVAVIRPKGPNACCALM